jgi:hypothetical protein
MEAQITLTLKAREIDAIRWALNMSNRQHKTNIMREEGHGNVTVVRSLLRVMEKDLALDEHLRRAAESTAIGFPSYLNEQAREDAAWYVKKLKQYETIMPL